MKRSLSDVVALLCNIDYNHCVLLLCKALLLVIRSYLFCPAQERGERNKGTPEWVEGQSPSPGRLTPEPVLLSRYLLLRWGFAYILFKCVVFDIPSFLTQSRYFISKFLVQHKKLNYCSPEIDLWIQCIGCTLLQGFSAKLLNIRTF